MAVATAVVVLVAAAAGFGLYRRQIVSVLTHWRGSPTHTRALEPFLVGAEPELRIAVVGDVGYANDRESKTGAAMVEAGESDPYDALLLLGDNVYPAGDPAALERTVLEPFRGVLDPGARLVAILGNHDVIQGHAEAQVAALGMPGRWYAERLGNDVTLVALDSTQWNSAELRRATGAAGSGGIAGHQRGLWPPTSRTGILLSRASSLAALPRNALVMPAPRVPTAMSSYPPSMAYWLSAAEGWP